MNSKKGFTLVEIVVVLVILSILAALVVPSVIGYVKDANDEKYINMGNRLVVACNSQASKLYTRDVLTQETFGEKVDDVIEKADAYGEFVCYDFGPSKKGSDKNDRVTSFQFKVKDEQLWIVYNKATGVELVRTAPEILKIQELKEYYNSIIEANPGISLGNFLVKYSADYSDKNPQVDPKFVKQLLGDDFTTPLYWQICYRADRANGNKQTVFFYATTNESINTYRISGSTNPARYGYIAYFDDVYYYGQPSYQFGATTNLEDSRTAVKKYMQIYKP